MNTYRIYFEWQGKPAMITAQASSMEAACEAVFLKYGYDLILTKTIKVKD